VLERAAAQGLLHLADPAVTTHLLGTALGSSLCAAVVYGSPPLDRLVPAAKDLVRRALTPTPGAGPAAPHSQADQ
jgi:hypothetical protein